VSKVVIEPNRAEISADERWELIERIRDSHKFRRAERLRELLLYIATQSIKAGVTVIPEQEIGEAVFGRSDDYDTSLDNIVRVNASELRKRLEHYFEYEGSQETLIVEIPRGAYIPVFYRRLLPGDEELLESEDSPDAGEVSASAADAIDPEEMMEEEVSPKKRRLVFRLGFWSITAIAVLLGCIAFLLWRNQELQTQIRPWQADPALRAFWSEFLGSRDEVDIVTADTSLALAEDILKRPVSLDDYLDYKYKNNVDLPGVSPETRTTVGMVLGRELGSVGDFRVAERVMKLDGNAANLKLASARAYAPESIKENNVILIGGPESNPWVDLYQDRMDFYVQYDVVQHHSHIINRSPAAGEQASYEIQAESNHGYSIVAFLPNLSDNRAALIIAGTDSQATLAAGEWVTSSAGLAAIRQKAPQGQFPFFEVLLASSKLVGTPLQTEVKAVRIHPR
jgi:hypothetical protein